MPGRGECDVAIVGGGESALSALVFLRGLRPAGAAHVYTPILPLSRGESFLENRVFADPDDVGWERARPARRGGTSSSTATAASSTRASLAAIAGDDRCRFVAGRVHPRRQRAATRVRARVRGARGRRPSPSTTTSSTAPASTCWRSCAALFPRRAAGRDRGRVGRLWDRPPGTEVPIGRELELVGMEPRLHIPGLAGLSQGPGFANLGSLGLLANRVLQPLLPELNGAGATADLSTAHDQIFIVRLGGWCNREGRRAAVVALGGGDRRAGAAGRLRRSATRLAAAAPAAAKACSSPTAPAIPASTCQHALRRRADQPRHRAVAEGRLETAADAQSTFGAYASTPVVVDGVIYSQDLESNVQAIDLESGEVLWTKKYEPLDQGPNGVTVAGRQGLRRDRDEAFALDQETGEELWSTPLVRSRTGKRSTWRPATTTASSTSRPCRPTSAPNTPAAASASSGRSTPKTGQESLALRHRAASSLWGEQDKSTRGGGLWYAPSFDEQGLDVLRHRQPGAVPRRPRRRPGARAGPGPNLYTDSMVKLDAKTGKLRVVLPADPARPLRLGLPGPADPGPGRRQGAGDRRRQVGASSSRSTRRPASRSGRRRSANTTATTTTACWRCAAKLPKLKKRLVYPGSSAA